MTWRITSDTGSGRSQNAKKISVHIFSGVSMNLKIMSTTRLQKPLGVIQIVRTHKGVSVDGQNTYMGIRVDLLGQERTHKYQKICI